jgi:ZIP family zinc transporter
MAPFTWEPLLASLLAGLATGLGGLPVLFGRRAPHRVFDGLLGFAAGVMLALSGPGLLSPALSEHRGAALAAGAAGGFGILALRLLLSRDRSGLDQRPRLGRGARVALGVTAHNLFEGLAVVAAYGSIGASGGLSLAVAIAAHNIPEGIAVAEPLRRAGMPAGACLGLATLSGLGEPLGAGIALALLGPRVAPSVGSAVAAGAMLVLASVELLPEAFGHGYVLEAAAGLLAGALLVLALLGAA